MRPINERLTVEATNGPQSFVALVSIPLSLLLGCMDARVLHHVQDVLMPASLDAATCYIDIDNYRVVGCVAGDDKITPRPYADGDVIVEVTGAICT